MSVREGMDTEAVREVAEAIVALAGRADAVRDSGSAMIRLLSVVWEGDDVARFEQGWEAAGPRLTEAAEGLRGAGEDLRRQVEDQVQTSGGEGGGSGGGDGGWGWPDLDLPDFDFPDLGNPFEGMGWDVPAFFSWPDIDWGGLWEGFLDGLEGIGDWWDDLPIWAQIVIGVVAAAVIVVVAIFAGIEIVGALAIVAAIAAVAGIVMTVLDMLDAVAEFLRDPEAAIKRFLDDPLSALDDLIWLAIGFLPLRIGKLLGRFRKPIRELLEGVAPWLKRKGDEIVDWFRKRQDDARRQLDRVMDRLTSPGNKRDLQGGLDKHEGPGKGQGHTLEKHVGRSDADLVDRATPKKGHTPPKDGSSTYPSAERAERATADTIRKEKQEIQDWLVDPDGEDTLQLKASHSYTTGRHVPSGGSADDVQDVRGTRVIIVRDPSMPEGYRIITSFPTP